MNQRPTILVSSPHPADLIARLAHDPTVIVPPNGRPLIAYAPAGSEALRTLGNVLRVLRGVRPIAECILLDPEAPARSYLRYAFTHSK